MTMHEACELAQHISDHVPGVRVMAIGMFVPFAECTDDTPWKVSALGEGMDRPWVLKSRMELALLVSAMGQLAPTADGMLF